MKSIVPIATALSFSVLVGCSSGTARFTTQENSAAAEIASVDVIKCGPGQTETRGTIGGITFTATGRPTRTGIVAAASGGSGTLKGFAGADQFSCDAVMGSGVGLSLKGGMITTWCNSATPGYAIELIGDRTYDRSMMNLYAVDASGKKQFVTEVGQLRCEAGSGYGQVGDACGAGGAVCNPDLLCRDADGTLLFEDSHSKGTCQSGPPEMNFAVAGDTFVGGDPEAPPSTISFRTSGDLVNLTFDSKTTTGTYKVVDFGDEWTVTVTSSGNLVFVGEIDPSKKTLSDEFYTYTRQ